jgi:hypothetical protein
MLQPVQGLTPWLLYSAIGGATPNFGVDPTQMATSQWKIGALLKQCILGLAPGVGKGPTAMGVLLDEALDVNRHTSKEIIEP